MLTFHVLTDFSAASANALRYAVVLARHTGGRIRLWHVWPETAGTARRYFTAPGLTTRRARQLLTELAQEISPHVECTASLLETDPARYFARLPATDQVLVAGNGRPVKALNTARQSTALYLVRAVAHPLLVVPITYRAGLLPQRIVFDTDQQPVRLPGAAQTIPALLAQLTDSGPPLTLTHLPGDVAALLNRIIPVVVGLHVYTTATAPEAREVAHQVQQARLLGNVAHTVASARHCSVEEGIRHAAARHRADLLTFVTRHRGLSESRFLSSVTAGLLAHSQVPVLTIREA